jgi:hypothetical protein
VACAEEAAALSAFARNSFVAAFGAQNTAEDMASFVAAAYSPDIQRKEIEDPRRQVFIAWRDGQIAGYAMTRDIEPEPCVSDRNALELQRLYGVGVGAPLMARCLAHALWLGRRTTWLGVWERNERATKFYARYGFIDVGSHDFVVGQDVQTDRIVQRTIDPLKPHPFPPRSSQSPRIGADALSDPSSETVFVPLPASEPLRTRVLDAFARAPRYELELQHGCSVLQVACALRVCEEEVADMAAALAAEGKLQRTRDTLFKPS